MALSSRIEDFAQQLPLPNCSQSMPEMPTVAKSTKMPFSARFWTPGGGGPLGNKALRGQATARRVRHERHSEERKDPLTCDGGGWVFPPAINTECSVMRISRQTGALETELQNLNVRT